jgi:RNA polymerase sigma-70 factor (ECF subfamily)
MARPDAFVALYERDAEAVLVFLTRRTLDVEVALDLTAETFAQAWRGWSRVRLDSPEEVRGWLFTIARRQLGQYWRRGHAERRALRRMGVSVPALHEEDFGEIERAAGLASLRSTLRTELQRLSGDQRDALQLRVVDELPYPAVARQLGITEATARARVSRGLRALAAALEPVALEQEASSS